MEYFIMTSYFISFFLSGLEGTGNHGNISLERLMTDLLLDYKRDAVPLVNMSTPVEVKLVLRLAQIIELNNKDQYISISGWLKQSWLDTRLQWNPEDYGGMNQLVMPPTSVWLPDTTLMNSVDAYYDENHFRFHRVRVHNSGLVEWAPGGRMTASCNIDVTYYPFDSQICYFRYGNWMYNREVNLTTYNAAEQLMMNVYKENGEFEVTEVSVQRRVHYYECCNDDPYSEIFFVIRLRRKSLFYVMSMVIPSLMLSCLALLVFCLPPELGDKVSMGLTILLSFSVFFLLIAENVPNTSLAVPLIQIYMVCFMGFASLTVCISVLVLHMYNKNGTVRPPAWLCKLATLMERFTCGNGLPTVDMEKAVLASAKPNNGDIGKQDKEGGVLESPPQSPGEETGKPKQDSSENTSKEWRRIANTCNSFCFGVFFLVIVLITIIALVIVPLSRPEKALSLE